MFLAITVDVEADNQWRKNKRENITLENIGEITRFQSLCEKYDYKPSYLVTYEVASDEYSVGLLKRILDTGNAEIGAHLHPWTTPPYSNDMEEFGKNTYPCELDNEALFEKLKNLTKKIQDSFGISPRSFRAGRWGFDKRMVGYLSLLGYDIDCSVTPKIDWRKVPGKIFGNGGPDFRTASVFPYYLSNSDICTEGESNVLELPMTILHAGLFNGEHSRIARLFLGLPDSGLKKILNKLFFKLTWCRILPGKNFTDLKRLFEVSVRNDLPLIEFMIHSSELLPGGSPYAKTPEAVENIYMNLEKFFGYLKNHNVGGLTLCEFAEYYKSKNADIAGKS